MAYSKKTWSNGEVITDTALNNIETGIFNNDAAIATKAAKGSNIATADATDSASTETVDVAEFKAVVALVNACKSELNKMNA